MYGTIRFTCIPTSNIQRKTLISIINSSNRFTCFESSNKIRKLSKITSHDKNKQSVFFCFSLQFFYQLLIPIQRDADTAQLQCGYRNRANAKDQLQNKLNLQNSVILKNIERMIKKKKLILLTLATLMNVHIHKI